MVGIHDVEFAFAMGLAGVLYSLRFDIYAHVAVPRLQERRGELARTAPQVQYARLLPLLLANLAGHGHQLPAYHAVFLDEIELEYPPENIPQSGPRRQPAHQPAHGGHDPLDRPTSHAKYSRTASTTARACSPVSSGYMGRVTISEAMRSASGYDPTPRSRKR